MNSKTYKHIRERTVTLFREAVRFIISDLDFPNFSLQVFNENNVVIDMDTTKPMASVTHYKGDTRLWLCAPRFSVLSTETAAFILLHETLHYALDHAKIYPTYENRLAFNLAADAIVNDILVEVLSPVVTRDDIVKEFKPIWGDKLFGFNCSEENLDKLYEILLEREELPTPEPHKLSDSDDDAFHSQMADSFKGGGESANNSRPAHRELSSDLEAQKEVELTITKMKLKLKQQKLVMKVFNKSIAKQLDHSAYSYSWVRMPKSRVALPLQDGMLPDYVRAPEQKPNPHVVIYIDVSGSVTDKETGLFINLLRALLTTDWNIEAFLFTTKIVPFPLDKLEEGVISCKGGGTKFNVVFEHVAAMKKMPDNVAIITDGEDRRLDIALAPYHNRWTWILNIHDHIKDATEITSRLFGRIVNINEVC